MLSGLAFGAWWALVEIVKARLCDHERENQYLDRHEASGMWSVVSRIQLRKIR